MKVNISTTNSQLILSSSRPIDRLNRADIHLSSQQATDARVGVGRLTDGQMANKAIERYYRVIEQSCPRWPSDLWLMAAEAFRGCSQMPDSCLSDMVRPMADFHDIDPETGIEISMQGEAAGANGIGRWPYQNDSKEKGTDAFAVMWVLWTEQTPAESMFVAEVVERFWGCAEDGRLDIRSILSELSRRAPNNVFLNDNPRWSVARIGKIPGSDAGDFVLTISPANMLDVRVAVEAWAKAGGGFTFGDPATTAGSEEIKNYEADALLQAGLAATALLNGFREAESICPGDSVGIYDQAKRKNPSLRDCFW